MHQPFVSVGTNLHQVVTVDEVGPNNGDWIIVVFKRAADSRQIYYDVCVLYVPL
jgi:microcompartment protein CcmK/EutM